MAVLPELPDVVMQKSTVIPRVHGMYKHNRTLGRTTQVMSLKKHELNPVKIVFPSCTSVDTSEKMEISVHTVQALELAKPKRMVIIEGLNVYNNIP